MKEAPVLDSDIRLLMKIGLLIYDSKTKRVFATEKAMNLTEEETAKLLTEACEEDEKNMNAYLC